MPNIKNQVKLLNESEMECYAYYRSKLRAVLRLLEFPC